jgi:hypothetical protein
MVRLPRIGHLPTHLCYLALPFLEQDLCAQRNAYRFVDFAEAKEWCTC